MKMLTAVITRMNSATTLRGKLKALIRVLYPSKISIFLTAVCAVLYCSASNLSHCMWKFSLFSQHYYSVYERSTYDAFCLSIFIASFLAIKCLWAVLYTSEHVRWPDGCSNKWGEMSEALLHTWAVRRTSPAPCCQRQPRHAVAQHTLVSRHEGNRHRVKDHPSGGITVLERGCFALAELSGCVSEICSQKPKPQQNIFCVFFLDGTHGFCYKHYPQNFKDSFELETIS